MKGMIMGMIMEMRMRIRMRMKTWTRTRMRNILIIPDDDGCAPMQAPKAEPKMEKLHEEFRPCDVAFLR